MEENALKMVLGDRIKALREKRGINQKELAKRIGVSKSAMSKIESESRKVEDVLLIRLTEVLDTSADYLLGIEPKKPIPSDLELSDDELIKKYNIVLDGQPIDEAILRDVLSYVRVRRSVK